MTKSYKTTVGLISAETLAFTAGKDPELDLRLVGADCAGTAAHVIMLSSLNLKPKLITPPEKKAVLMELAKIARLAKNNSFKISQADQDVHLAIERSLTARLGDTGKKIHAGRSRNDQVAVALRLYAKERLFAVAENALRLGNALLRLAAREKMTPMVGRTHMQPAMPSSVGLWASAYAECLADDLEILKNAFSLNDLCPLGSAAGYGVSLPVNRRLVSDLLGFRRPIHNVIHAANSRGKVESVILSTAAQVMITLSRLAQDLILFTMPEFGYFSLPERMCTGSSIMPQKKNPDILELIRAKAACVLACSNTALEITRGLPSGYNRDLQEIKGPFMEGLETTGASLKIMALLMEKIKTNRPALLAAFSPCVFATDRALELTAKGKPFREAYDHVKEHLPELANVNPAEAVRAKRHLGAPGGLNLNLIANRLNKEQKYFKDEKNRHQRKISALLGKSFLSG